LFALKELAFSLLVVHFVWALAYVLGSLVLTAFGENREGNVTPGRALFELVVSSACGLATLGLAAFACALPGLLYAPALLVIFLLAAVLSGARRCGASQAGFWRFRWLIIKRAITPYTASAWALAILLGIPAILPDHGPDSQAFLLPQAFDWAETHRLSVDQFLRFPYYTENWPLLYAWLFVFKLGDYTSLLSWLCVILSALGIQSLIADFEASPSSWGRISLPYLRAALAVAPLGFLISPATLRWEWTSMQDLAQGFIFLAFMLSSVAALRSSEDTRPLAATVITAAFFVGMKTSFVAFLPLSIVVISLVCARNHRQAATLALALGGLIVLSAPWYVRSFVLGGDPIAPVLNLKFQGVDKKLTPEDQTGIVSDLRLGQSLRPIDLLKIPWRITFHTASITFREYGVTLAYLFLYVPFVVLLMAIFRLRRWLDAESVLMSVILGYAILYWLATSYMARYTLMFAPALYAFGTYLIIRLTKRSLQGAVLALAALLVLAVPSTGLGYYFISNQLQAYDWDYFAVYKSRDTYQKRLYAEPYWSEIKYLIAFENRPKSAKRIYAVGPVQWRLEFRRYGITLIGDWFGPERYIDLDTTIHLGRFSEYVRRFGFDAMIVSPEVTYMQPHVVRHLEEQAASAGFRIVRLPGSKDVLLLRR